MLELVMKCEVCLPLLEEYVDAELKESDVAVVNDHLLQCSGCTAQLELLRSEQEMYSHYDRDLTISPAMWNEIAARTISVAASSQPQRASWRDWFALPRLNWSYAGALAVLVLAAVLGGFYLSRSSQQVITPVSKNQSPNETPKIPSFPPIVPQRDEVAPQPVDQVAVNPRHAPSKTRRNVSNEAVAATDQSDVLFSDAAVSAVEEQETQAHIESAQNLLRDVRNIQVGDDETDVDVSYEKGLSRKLLNENVVLRREAEMKGKFPTKTLLADLEPFLIDIANLPDRAASEDLRVLKQRVAKTEIVAALQGY
jgi:hypothetical protein